MLSRTADSLYWLARYMERAENIARIVMVGHRMSSLTRSLENSGNEWHSTLHAAGCEPEFFKKHAEASPALVIDYLVRDPDNPSSIYSCLETARRNARAVRTALTVDMWDALNETWHQARSGRFAVKSDLPALLDWVKERSLLFAGAYANTMLRNDAFYFTRLGTFIERADNTARILDVKYHLLLPAHEQVGGPLDYFQWAAILRSVSAHTAYHWVYRENVKPWLVADLLMLKDEMPRSLASCYENLVQNLDRIAHAYGRQGPAQRQARAIRARLENSRIEEIFQSGLHEFIDDFIEDNNRLGTAIAQQYLL
jgi:uncharacterized alpha-E superfamily protein